MKFVEKRITLPIPTKKKMVEETKVGDDDGQVSFDEGCESSWHHSSPVSD